MSKKALLMILDGWGLGDQKKDDVIFNTPTPYWDYLMNTYPHSQLQASGENVGLPDGQMGNSEVGHLNIGAGRVVYQDLTVACIAHSFISSNFVTSLKNIISTIHSSTALWTVVILIRRAVKVLSKNYLRTVKSQQERLLQSSAVIMLWTVTNVGNV